MSAHEDPPPVDAELPRPLTPSTPQKIDDIVLGGKKYDLAKNGIYLLAEDRGTDLYGRPFAVKVCLSELTVEEIQSLLNLLGESYQSLRHLRDVRTSSRLAQIGEKDQ